MPAVLDSRREREDLEDRMLAPWAVRSRLSRGRRYPEPRHEFRTEFQRDRDRVLYSKSFRRLEYKTQVFVNGTADHYRTRLTHTMEMAAIGRTLARALRANEDLVEAIALAHDIGHSPFGHVGEEALNELMKERGGFDHNEQSCRAVELIEHPYPHFPGLNLTWEVRAGLRKHRVGTPGLTLDGIPLGPHLFLEGQIADLADEMAYYAHDVDDGLEAGLIAVADLNELPIWREAMRRAAVSPEDPDGPRAAVRALLDMQVEDVLHTTAERLTKYDPKSPEDVMAAPERIVDFSPAMKVSLAALRTFLFEHLYYHPAVSRDSQAAVRMMRRLFLFYIEHPEAMGRKARARLATEGLWRTVCDYIAGMTDRYALEEIARHGLNTSDKEGST